MTARELLHAEIDSLDEQGVRAVSQLVHQYVKSQPAERSGDLFTLLRGVSIEGPVDFSSNLDLYMDGQKSVSKNIR